MKIICTQCNLNNAERHINHKQVFDKEEVSKYTYMVEIEDICMKCRWFNIQQAGIRLGALRVK